MKKMIQARPLLTLFLFASMFMLQGCSAKLADYQETEQQVELKDYFSGELVAWGLVQDFSGKATRRFCVQMTGRWQDDTGILDEWFVFDDGEKSQRVWTLTRKNDGQYQGTAPDVVGVAFGQGQSYAFHWQYQLQLNVNDETYLVTLDDWLYQVDRFRMFNRTEIKKWGITVGYLTLFFDKQQPIRHCDNAFI